jgi:hypothetical protein
MIVKEIIETLSKYYHPDSNLVVDWADFEQFNDGDLTEEIWNKAVDSCEYKDVGLNTDFIQELIIEAQDEVESTINPIPFIDRLKTAYDKSK